MNLRFGCTEAVQNPLENELQQTDEHPRMSWFRRLIGGTDDDGSAPPPLSEEQQPLPGVAGRITARKAVELAEQVITEHDPDRRLVQILSDSNITAEGESFGWELVYDMPSRDRKVIVIIDICPDSIEDAEPALCVPFWENTKLSLATFGKPALPVQGLVRGPGGRGRPGNRSDQRIHDVTLSSERLEDASVAWEVQAGGETARTSFT